jgi:hypothetical protein
MLHHRQVPITYLIGLHVPITCLMRRQVEAACPTVLAVN